MKKSLVGEGIRGEVETSEKIGTSLLPAWDFGLGTPASSSCFPEKLAGELTQKLRWVVQDPRAIGKEEEEKQ